MLTQSALELVERYTHRLVLPLDAEPHLALELTATLRPGAGFFALVRRNIVGRLLQLLRETPEVGDGLVDRADMAGPSHGRLARNDDEARAMRIATLASGDPEPRLHVGWARCWTRRIDWRHSRRGSSGDLLDETGVVVLDSVHAL
jgi:hypothetical protein